MSKKTERSAESCRLGKVGGQAVIEGVMMKNGNDWSLAVRKENGEIEVTSGEFTSVRKKNKLLDLPIIRGVVNYVEMMMLSYKMLSLSAEAIELEGEGEPSKLDLWIEKHMGKAFMNILMAISSVLGVVLGIFLFSALPTFIAGYFDSLAENGIGWYKNLIEGILRMLIFVAYVSLTGLMKDIKRMYQYHGAEHKSIYCYESGEELTPENAKKQSRLHPRCGTSFLFVMLMLSILVFSLPFVTWDNYWLRLITKIALLPLIVGIGYEFIMYAGKHDNLFVRIVSYPGLLMQKITTREPDEKQLEVAITALKCSMQSEFPGERDKYKKAAEGSKEAEDDGIGA